jgi:hypothetical protein
VSKILSLDDTFTGVSSTNPSAAPTFRAFKVNEMFGITVVIIKVWNNTNKIRNQKYWLTNVSTANCGILM